MPSKTAHIHYDDSGIYICKGRKKLINVNKVMCERDYARAEKEMYEDVEYFQTEVMIDTLRREGYTRVVDDECSFKGTIDEYNKCLEKKLEQAAALRANCERAEDPCTSIDDLDILSKNDEKGIRCHVARNPHARLETLVTLAHDPHMWVRGNVAINPSAPPELLDFLAKDESTLVRANVASNLNTPAETRDLLANDTEPLVQRIATGQFFKLCPQ